VKTVGRREHVLIRRVTGKKWTLFSAKLDTAAFWSRIGAREAAKLGLGPITHVLRIRTSGGRTELRVLVPATLRIGGHRIAANFTVSTRRPGILIGRRTMGKRFTVAPSKRYLTSP
jgi:hypothetical protein